MLDRSGGYVPPEHKDIGIEVSRIPDDLTEKGMVLVINKKQDNEAPGDVRKRNQGLYGVLQNGPIEVGKRILCGADRSTEVVRIIQKGDVYTIKTKSGSEYNFDTTKSFKFPERS